MITARQSRAARALLGWTQETLADKARTSLTALNASMGLGVKLNDAGTDAGPSAPGYWNGKFDDLAFFNHALSAGEVAQIKADGDAGISVIAPAPEPGSAMLTLAGLGAFIARRRR